jgi:hypothetical protein
VSLRIIHYAPGYEEVRERGHRAPPFLTSALNDGQWSASCPCRFTPGERALGTHWIGVWLGPRKNFAPAGNRTLAVPPVTTTSTTTITNTTTNNNNSNTQR